MAEVREVRFIGINITKDGMKTISPRNPKISSNSIDQIDLKIDDVKEQASVQPEKEAIPESTNSVD